MSHLNKRRIVNILTVLRIIGIPFIFLISNKLLLFAYVNFLFLTDFLDGYYARKWNVVSNTGAILDLMADKILVIVLLSVALVTNNITLLLWALIVGREIYSIIIRIFAMRKSAKLINASLIGKLKTTFQFIALDALILDMKFAPVLLWFVIILSYWSIINYRVIAKKGDNE